MKIGDFQNQGIKMSPRRLGDELKIETIKQDLLNLKNRLDDLMSKSEIPNPDIMTEVQDLKRKFESVQKLTIEDIESNKRFQFDMKKNFGDYDNRILGATEQLELLMTKINSNFDSLAQKHFVEESAIKVYGKIMTTEEAFKKADQAVTKEILDRIDVGEKRISKEIADSVKKTKKLENNLDAMRVESLSNLQPFNDFMKQTAADLLEIKDSKTQIDKKFSSMQKEMQRQDNDSRQLFLNEISELDQKYRSIEEKLQQIIDSNLNQSRMLADKFSRIGSAFFDVDARFEVMEMSRFSMSESMFEGIPYKSIGNAPMPFFKLVKEK